MSLVKVSLDAAPFSSEHHGALTEGDNTRFTAEELTVLHQQLGRIGAQLVDAQIRTEAERKALDSVLAAAKDSSTRLRKKDPKAALLGTLMGMAMSGAASTDTMRAAWNILRHVFDAAQKLLR